MTICHELGWYHEQALVPIGESFLLFKEDNMAEELTKEEKQRLKEERRKAFEAAHPELAAKRKEADQKKQKVQQKKEEVVNAVNAALLNDQEAARREKMNALREKGIDPFGQAFERDHNSATIKEVYGDKTQEELNKLNAEVSIAGRIMSKRRMGKLGFIHLLDREGRIQVVINQRIVGDDIYDFFKSSDLGDILGIKGRVIKTQTGELSVECHTYTHLAKALKP